MRRQLVRVVVRVWLAPWAALTRSCSHKARRIRPAAPRRRPSDRPPRRCTRTNTDASPRGLRVISVFLFWTARNHHIIFSKDRAGVPRWRRQPIPYRPNLRQHLGLSRSPAPPKPGAAPVPSTCCRSRPTAMLPQPRFHGNHVCQADFTASPLLCAAGDVCWGSALGLSARYQTEHRRCRCQA